MDAVAGDGERVVGPGRVVDDGRETVADRRKRQCGHSPYCGQLRGGRQYVSLCKPRCFGAVAACGGMATVTHLVTVVDLDDSIFRADVRDVPVVDGPAPGGFKPATMPIALPR